MFRLLICWLIICLVFIGWGSFIHKIIIYCVFCVVFTICLFLLFRPPFFVPTKFYILSLYANMWLNIYILSSPVYSPYRNLYPFSLNVLCHSSIPRHLLFHAFRSRAKYGAEEFLVSPVFSLSFPCWVAAPAWSFLIPINRSSSPIQ